MQRFDGEVFHSQQGPTPLGQLQELGDAPLFLIPPPQVEEQATLLHPEEESYVVPARVSEMNHSQPGAIVLAAYEEKDRAADGLYTELPVSQPNQDEDKNSSQHGSQEVTDPPVQEMALLIENGDEALKVGDLSTALRSYHRAATLVQGKPLPSLTYRQGLASEAAGALTESLSHYEYLCSQSPGTFWEGLGIAGKLRCWMGLGKADLVLTEAFRRAIADPRGLPPILAEDILMMVSQVVARNLPNLEVAPEDLLNDSRFMSPTVGDDFSRHLLRLEELSHYTSEVPPPIGIRKRGQFAKTAFGTLLSIHLVDVPVIKVISALAETSGIPISLSKNAESFFAGHLATLVNSNIRMSLALHSLCLEGNLIWQEQNGLVHVYTPAECDVNVITSYQQNRTRDILEMTSTEYPEHPHTHRNSILLGVWLAGQHQFADAASVLQAEVANAEPTALKCVAAYNLGKCLLHTPERQEAIAAFVVAADLHATDSLSQGATYLYLARLQLENGDLRQAASSAMRAMSLCDGSPLESTAVELLAGVYLLSRNAHGANAVLMKYQSDSLLPESADRLAFLAALARYHAALDLARRTREAEAVLEAVSHVDQKSAFGDFWVLLVAEAYEELGLQSYAMDVYQQALKRTLPVNLRNQVTLKSAKLDPRQIERLKGDGKLHEVNQASHLAINETCLIRDIESRINKGEMLEAVDLSKRVLAECENTDTRRQTLKLLGRAYQRLGDYDLAIQCFSGTYAVPSRRIPVNGETSVGQGGAR